MGNVSDRGVESHQEKIWTHWQNISPEVFGAAKPRLNFLLKQIARKAKTKTSVVLNVGVGDGYFEDSSRIRGWDTYSMDPDEKAISSLADRGIKGHVGRLEKMPFESEMFDFVVASEVLEHLTDEQRRKGLQEIARVTKAGGWFICTVPYQENLNDNKVVCPDCGKTFHRWGHQKSFDIKSIETELSEVLNVRRVKRTAFVELRDRSILGKVKSVVRWIMARCGAAIAVPSIYAEARKGTT